MTKFKRITKEDIKLFPEFKNHEEAIDFLRNKYKDNLLGPSDDATVDGKKVYFFSYILDRDTFERMQAWIEKHQTRVFPPWKEETRGFTASYQSVHIWEDGKIKVSS
ncbi:hypothetical protein HNP21_005517 [Bacillus aryabhattai]|uniref:Uncharacterized protein n=1 Tax=Priestia aryabhattai TaxID=412384 RepID=A0A7W3NG63_PRIAR|nr:hypothetical protein [Priestia aryabhattai]MBA9042382.1 hypothetical protein [Priestia aryabhattai]